MNKFLFLLPVMGQPRYAKRIDMLQAEGVEAKAVYFERNYHSGRKPNCEVSCLGEIEHGKYLKRGFIYLAAIRKIRKAAKKTNVIYSFELDLAFLAFVATIGLNIKRVVEIGDIREVQTGTTLISRVLRFIEKDIVKKFDLLVVTAPKFYTEYYQKWLKIDVQHLVIENKLDQSFILFSQTSKEVSEQITIGYFGLLRCQWSAEILFKLAKEYADKFSIVLAGKWMLSKCILDKLEKLDNVVFLGEYKSPAGLNEIYSKVDLVWSCYEPLEKDNKNLHWAKTNRFYESLFFKKPLIVRAGSQDGEFVYENEIGLVVDSDDCLENDLSVFSDLNNEKIYMWANKIKELDVCNYVYTDEAKTMLRKLGLTNEL